MPSKAIPEARDRLQSRLLVWAVGAPIACFCLYLAGLLLMLSHHDGLFSRLLSSLGVSLTFAAAVWLLRLGTPQAALTGGAICWIVTFGGEFWPLFTTVVLTALATRAGRRRKVLAGVAESRRGRRASQVAANLAAAALILLLNMAVEAGLLPFGYRIHGVSLVLAIAALAEATMDTVSSEIGQAYGSTPFLLTTLRRVPAGTDGAISLLGTTSGVAAGAVVCLIGSKTLALGADAWAAFAGATAGLLIDSLLGATVERRGWLGNDLVNFTSTVAAALVAYALLIGPARGLFSF